VSLNARVEHPIQQLLMFHYCEEAGDPARDDGWWACGELVSNPHSTPVHSHIGAGAVSREARS